MSFFRQTERVPILEASAATGWSASSILASPLTITARTVVSSPLTLLDGTVKNRIRVSSLPGDRLELTQTGSWSLAGRRGLEFDLFVHHLPPAPSGLSGTVRIFSATAGYFAHFLLTQGWNTIRVGRRDLGVLLGSPNWNDSFTDFRLRFEAIPGQALDVSISDISYAGYARPQVCIMFDDGYEDVLAVAKPILDEVGVPGTVAVISRQVETSGFLSAEQLKSMHADGWAMVNHSARHLQNVLPGSSAEACRAEIAECRDWLESQGFTRDQEHRVYCAPYGEYSASYLEGARSAGMVAFRGTMGSNSTLPSQPGGSDMSPSLFPFPCISGINTWSVATHVEMIERCLAAGRSAVVLFHRILPTASGSIEWSESNFREFLGYLHRRRAAIEFVTLPQWVKGQSFAG